MMNITEVLNSINGALKMLNERECKIYDSDNPDFYLDRIEYDDIEDKLNFYCENDSI